MRLALAQIISSADKRANLDAVQDQVVRAADAGAELVIFPEATMCAFGNRLDTVAEPLDGPWVSRLTAIAAASGVTAVAGMFTPSEQRAPDGRTKVGNTLVVTGPDGLVSYRKIHLFDAFGFAESDTVVPGTEPVVTPIGGLQVGLTVCYDVRFPGLYTRLADQGAELIIVSASWGAGPGKVAQWQLLTQARALDSTCFVAAVGQADPATQGIKTRGSAPTGVGYSALIDPAGGAVIGAGAEPELLVVDVETERLPAIRETIPVIANRRF
ncbi:carbon-nitrogen hydrolase family protein [Microlunatus soli]|uniref:Predicted amidohydrolase n=1 Tax=Microlunatus soli TaxID=630515 RepID=A0A1H1MQH9_9ACTN|nr:carbon-nitrogen hydrolase family protein [Microlunatus soli]SDR88978.1 Predicted amidohydrolase [Microlunatus soli]